MFLDYIQFNDMRYSGHRVCTCGTRDIYIYASSLSFSLFLDSDSIVLF